MNDYIKMNELSKVLPLELVEDLVKEVYDEYEKIGDIDIAIEEGIKDSMLLEEVREFLIENKEEIENGVKFHGTNK